VLKEREAAALGAACQHLASEPLRDGREPHVVKIDKPPRRSEYRLLNAMLPDVPGSRRFESAPSVFRIRAADMLHDPALPGDVPHHLNRRLSRGGFHCSHAQISSHEAEGTTERLSAFCARFNIQKAAHFLDLYFSKSDIDDFGRSQEVQRV